MKNEYKCPLCSSKEKQNIESEFVYGGNKNDKYLHCKICDMFYLHPKPTKIELDKFYKNEFEDFMTNRSGSDSDWSDADKHFEISNRDAIRRLTFLDKALTNATNILEVGASTGFMIQKINKNYIGKNIVAIEPSNIFCDYMKKKNIETYQSIEELPKESKFDLILHFFVVAHVYDFKDFLEIYYSKLAIGGKMIFETPSATDALRTLYDIPEFNKFYWQVAHLVSFTNKSMKILLDTLGYTYKIYPHQRYDLSNHMVWMQSGKPGGREKYSTIFSSELETNYKKSLEDKWKCDTIIVEIEKR